MGPLVLSVAILVWFFQKVDSFFSPLIDRIPGFRTVCSTAGSSRTPSPPRAPRLFKRVLMVEWPKADSYALGFRTGRAEREGRPLAVVFVPTHTPHFGEVLSIPKEKTWPLSLSVEQGV